MKTNLIEKWLEFIPKDLNNKQREEVAQLLEDASWDLLGSFQNNESLDVSRVWHKTVSNIVSTVRAKK